MENDLIIKATNKTPYVNFNAKTGKLHFLGYSLPENSIEFYEPIIKWLNKYALTPHKKTEFDIRFIIINTSSSKMFLDVIRIINHLVKLDTTDVSVVWYYEQEDEDMHETALQYKEVCKAKFDIIGIHHKLIE